MPMCVYRKANPTIIFGIWLLVLIFLAFGILTGVQAQAPLISLDTGYELFDLAWSPDGAALAVSGMDGIRIYDTALNQLTYLPGEAIVSVSWHPDGGQLAGAGGFAEGQGSIQIWDRDIQTEGYVLHTTLYNDHYQTFVASWSPDGTKLATMGRDIIPRFLHKLDTIEIWDATTWTMTTTLPNQYLDSALDLIWSPDSTRIAGGGITFCDEKSDCGPREYGYYVADVVTGDELQFGDTIIEPSSLAWLSDGRLFVDDFRRGVSLFDPATGDLLSDFGAGAYRLKQSPNEDWLAVARGRDLVYIRNIPTFIYTLELPVAPTFFAMDWSPDGNQLATVSETGIIEIRDVSILPDLSGTRPLRPIQPIPQHQHRPSHLRLMSLESGVNSCTFRLQRQLRLSFSA